MIQDKRPKYNDVTSFMGKKVEGAMERALKEAEGRNEVVIPTPISASPVITPVNFDPSKYVIHPSANLLVPVVQSYGGFNYETTMKKVYADGYKVMTMKEFIDYFTGIKDASEGKLNLSYADGTQLNNNETKELWDFLSSTTRTRGNCWTWLNGMFKKEGIIKKHFVLETVTGIDGNGDLVVNREKLEGCLNEACYVKLEFNSQGLPVKKSNNQNYSQGENLYYYHPTENCVARFLVDSDWSFLGCDRNPSDSSAALGVRAAREKI